MFECRVRRDRFPEDGETVVGKITAISEDVVSVELLEYGNIQGMIMSNELSKKRFRTVSQVVKVGSIEVCLVLKVEQDTGFVDLSLKRVTGAEKQECKNAFSKTKLAYNIVAKASKLSGVPIHEMYEPWGYEKEAEYGSLFEYFAAAKNNLEMLDGEINGQYFRKIIEEQFKTSSFKVRVDVDVVNASRGVAGIKEAFGRALVLDEAMEVTLYKSPTYSIVKVSESKEAAFEAVNRACEIVKEAVEADGGTFCISNPAKVYGEKARHGMLEQTVAVEDE